MRRDREKLADYARRHGVAKFSTRYEDILEDPDIDAVYVATPPDSHAFYAMEAARHGKAVYVEKPMARTVREAEEMVRVCRDAGVPLFVAYYRRAQPRFLKARELIRGGALGEVRSFQYLYACPVPGEDPARPWLLSREKAGGGLRYDIGSHMIDSILFLLGESTEVIGRSGNLSRVWDTDDLGSALMRFVSGVQGTVQLSFCATESIDRLWISGSRGSLTLSIMGYEPLLFEHEGQTESIGFPHLEHVQQPLIQRVVNTLLGRDSLDATGASALQTQEILEAIDRSGSWVSQP